METKRGLKFYALIFAGFVATVLVIYRDVIFQERPPFESSVNKILPDVSLRSSESEQKLFRVLDQSKKKKAVIAMWATWCEPCVRELPMIEASLDKFAKEDTAVILINYDGGAPDKTIPEVKAWLVAHNLKLETYFDFDEKLLQELSVSALPFAVGVSSNRKIEWMELGELDWTKEVSVKN